MYKLMVKKEFSAIHFLIGGDFGEENKKHSHSYELELEIEGSTLDKYNFLADIVEVEKTIDEVIDDFKDKILNERLEFKNQNPSLEYFSKILFTQFKEKLNISDNYRIIVNLWENKNAKVTFWI